MSGGQDAPATLAIVGNAGGTNVGESLRRAADALGRPVQFYDAYSAVCGSRLLRSLAWRFAGKRPPYLRRFSASVVAACARSRPDLLLATGAAPLTRSALRALRGMGIFCVNYSTDDPWNQALRASWHLRALPEYDVVFTTRRGNIGDLEALGCRDVRWLPFGYDEMLCRRPDQPADVASHDVLFVGGADRDRVAFMTAFMRSGPPVALVGGYWERYPATRPYALGHKPPEAVAALTAAAKVNLCLVRRANRDGHVMRSFETAAIGGCMVVEDTAEHREIFGPDDETVVYFRTAEEAAERVRFLLSDSVLRDRLTGAVRARIVSTENSYLDRLQKIFLCSQTK